MLSRRQLRIKAIKALYAHLKSESDDMILSEKEMMAAIDRSYDLYFQMLALPVCLARYAAERIELGRKKQLPTEEDLHPNMRFVENAAIAMIARTPAIFERLAARKLGWDDYPELMRVLYARLTESDYFKAYMTAPESGFKADTALLATFFERELQDCALLDDVLEEQSILWNDDLGFVLTVVIRTLQNMRPSHGQVKPMPEFRSEEDKLFVRTLFEKTLVNYSDRLACIEQFTRNWDIERIVFIDHLVLATAITELIEFPEIPVKVTLDEYIDIAKFYSTPGSSPFINGVLDKVVDALKSDGKVCKSGKGLL